MADENKCKAHAGLVAEIENIKEYNKETRMKMDHELSKVWDGISKVWDGMDGMKKQGITVLLSVIFTLATAILNVLISLIKQPLL